MHRTTKEQIVEAVNILITADGYGKLLHEMTTILEEWAAHPMQYAGKLAPLNALLDVGVSNRGAFERIIKIVEAKRRLIPEVRRVDYQRDYMAERRARLAKSVELREIHSGPFKDRANRNLYEKDVTARWMTARGEFIAAKGKLGWAERNAAANEFWASIDATLDRNLADARSRVRVKA